LTSTGPLFAVWTFLFCFPFVKPKDTSTLVFFLDIVNPPALFLFSFEGPPFNFSPGSVPPPQVLIFYWSLWRTPTYCAPRVEPSRVLVWFPFRVVYFFSGSLPPLTPAFRTLPFDGRPLPSPLNMFLSMVFLFFRLFDPFLVGVPSLWTPGSFCCVYVRCGPASAGRVPFFSSGLFILVFFVFSYAQKLFFFFEKRFSGKFEFCQWMEFSCLSATRFPGKPSNSSLTNFLPCLRCPLPP